MRFHENSVGGGNVCIGLSVLAAPAKSFSALPCPAGSFDNPILGGRDAPPQRRLQSTAHHAGDAQHLHGVPQKSGKEEVRVKCTLVPLQARTGFAYTLNDKNERVLARLTFKGDNATHQF